MKYLLLTIALMAAPLPALAHAFLQTAQPPVGAALAAPPTQLVLNYTEGLQFAFCSVTVTNEAGQQMQDGKPVRGANDKQMIVKLHALTPGTYKVTWHAVATDTHHTEGSYSFSVKE
jgi:copper resistance protein C